MHELDITKQLTKKIKQIVKENDIGKYNLKAIVELGRLSTFSKEPLMHYYKLIAKEDDVLSKIKLEITIKEGKILCNDCKSEKIIYDFFDKVCDKCNSINTEIREGRDVFLKKIEKS